MRVGVMARLRVRVRVCCGLVRVRGRVGGKVRLRSGWGFGFELVKVGVRVSLRVGVMVKVWVRVGIDVWIRIGVMIRVWVWVNLPSTPTPNTSDLDLRNLGFTTYYPCISHENWVFPAKCRHLGFPTSTCRPCHHSLPKHIKLSPHSDPNSKLASLV